MNSRILANTLRQACKIQSRQSSNVPPAFYGQMTGEVYYGGKKYNKIGDREIVAHGFNGEPCYIDCSDHPFPAIRYKEITPDIKALREKEKGDWKNLSIQDKKALYRYSFRQTFAEFEANMGIWKAVLGYAMCGVAAGIWLAVIIKKFVAPPLPESFSRENQLEKVRLLKLLDSEPITNPLKGY